MSINPVDDHQLKGLIDRLEQNITIVDVGCRWGVSNIWNNLRPRVDIFGFDADAEECNRLNIAHRGEGITFIPKALADTAGQRTLYITSEPACSSIYKPDPNLTNNVTELFCAREVKNISLDVTTLDSWAKDAGISKIDFLKLDTQGSELDILVGAEEVLRSVRALEVEVEFNPIYIDQPLFADVDIHLRKRGYVLWKLSNMAHYSNHNFSGMTLNEDTHYYESRPVVRETMAGQIYWGHAYYVKSKIAHCTSKATDANQDLKDAALMHVLGFRDISAKLLNELI